MNILKLFKNVISKQFELVVSLWLPIVRMGVLVQHKVQNDDAHGLELCFIVIVFHFW